jgi:RNA polymerase sigma-70 factor, ECF subfamily
LIVKQRRDEELMEEIGTGHTDALGVLFDRYHRLILDVANRILRDRGEAEDLMQEVFLEIYRKAELYDPAKGSVRTWLLQYAYHRSFNRRKYLALRRFYDASPAAALVDLELAGERGGREDRSIYEWQEILENGMKELNRKERAVIEAVAFDGLTVREASERLRESYVNGRNHYYRALRKLRQALARFNRTLPREVKDVQP